MMYNTSAALPLRSFSRRAFAFGSALLPALVLGASAGARLLLPTPFAVRCTGALLVPSSSGSETLGRASAMVLVGLELLLAAGLVLRRTRRAAQLITAVELVVVSMAAAALAQPELLWMGVGLAPLPFLFPSHLPMMLATVACVLLIAGAFVARGDSESLTP